EQVIVDAGDESTKRGLAGGCVQRRGIESQVRVQGRIQRFGFRLRRERVGDVGQREAGALPGALRRNVLPLPKGETGTVGGAVEIRDIDQLKLLRDIQVAKKSGTGHLESAAGDLEYRAFVVRTAR